MPDFMALPLILHVHCHSIGRVGSTVQWHLAQPQCLHLIATDAQLGKAPKVGGMECLSISMELADANFTTKPAGFIAEPILSAGGGLCRQKGYQAVRKECDKRGMMLIFDEAQTGLGKTGKLFGFEHEDGGEPDIIAISKHFGGGLPISAVCTTAEIAQKAVDNGYFATRSHATDPLLCAAGEESLNIVVEEDMPGKAKKIERMIKSAFRKMAREFDIIGDIRGRGVLLGIELVKDRKSKKPANKETS